MNWVFFTLGAVVLQTFRNALQSKLSASVSTSGVTLARFLFAPPIALAYLCLLYLFSNQIVPDFTSKFLLMVCLAALLQIAATSFMVVLFKQQNFSVGAGLAKSEALFAGVIGSIFFASHLSLMGWLGIVLGSLAVFILSGGSHRGGVSIQTAAIGLACGCCFALTSLFVREASQLLAVPFPHSAAWVLLWVLCIQTCLMIGYISLKDKGTFTVLKRHKKLTVLTSLSSCLGSICWFSAMALQHVAYVKTLGQIEVLTTMIIAVFWLKNRVKVNEIVGLLLIACAAILVMWA